MKFRRRSASLLIIGAAATLLAGTQPSSAATAVGIPILNYLSSPSLKCLQPVGASLEQGAAIVQEICDFRNPAQQWEPMPILLPLGGKMFRYRNINSGLCLDALGGATNGTPIVQWTCNTISNELWEHPVGEGPDDLDGPLISRVSGTRSHCLDVPGGSTAAGLAMQLYRCNGTSAQIWGI
ncbi:RICIN domain-containing protein [Nonomuraea sp. NPDC003804]|uniref:RICIN domain-containing protein n=1 Tax=Nonomuraea sp. NPDC003804 TaxID=3154547 RepID=UPI00339FFA58